MEDEPDHQALMAPDRQAALALERLAVELLQYRPEQARAHGLSNQHVIILASIYDAPGCGVTAISGQSGMFQSTVSRSLSSLFKKELVRRQTSAQDTRASELFLTAEGEKVVTAIRLEWRARVSAMMDGLTAAERDALLSGLRILTGVVHHLTADQRGGTAPD